MKFIFINNELKLFEDETEIGHIVLGKQSENVYSVLRVFVSEDKRNKSFASALMNELVNLAQKNLWKLIPACSFAVAFFNRHTEYDNLVYKK